MNANFWEDPHRIYRSTSNIQEVNLMFLHMGCVSFAAAFREESREESKRG